ncbi:MAG: Do family serine endopeptidase [Spirochaetales bacterium]|nr:Do family serine endopeptidase [Spirochaetales bacterium]
MSSDRKQLGKTIAVAFFSTIAGFALCLTLYSFLPSRMAPAQSVMAAPNESEIATMENFQNSFRKVAAESLPWVVEIDVVEVTTRSTTPFGNGAPWNFFFGNPQQGEEGETTEREFKTPGLGSGFIVEQDGNTYYVVTNNHVAGKADEISIKMDNGDEYEAELVGADERKDLALLKFESRETLPVARLGDSDGLYVGDWVLAIGSPFGYKSSVSAGIISALGRQNGPDGNINDFIQTDAAINQGNSGGPLVNMKGEVVGINTWITTSTGGSIGLGFSIPINNVKQTVRDFIDKGEVQYGWLGVSIGDLPEDVATSMDLDERTGAFVYQVFTNSPADDGGIHPGDYILAVNGKEAQDKNHLTRMIGDMRPGDHAEFLLIRNGQKMSVTVKIKARASEEDVKQMNNQAWPGVSVFPLIDSLRERMDLDEEVQGVFVAEVYPKTTMQVAGIQSGDIITGVNGETVESLKEFYTAMAEIGSGQFYISFYREGHEMETARIRKK